jgi:hypothetical protein
MPTETATLEPLESSAPEVAPAPAEPVSAGHIKPRLKVEEFVECWQGISRRAGALLRDPTAPQFLAAVQRADDDIMALLGDESERSLLMMIQGAGASAERYSVHHALLVTAVCELAARLLPGCTDDMRRSLRNAALTMNIGMTHLQDQLALQHSPLTADQRTLVQGHAERGHELLGELGVTDALWLQAVLHHHDAPPGALVEQPVGMQLARLIQRADLFAARMSPRKLRAALSANVAAKGTYLDERKQPDMAGALVIKALGVYPAGSYVQLASGELAVVLKRGPLANKPLVAAIADGNGSPYVQPAARGTDTRLTAVVQSVPPKDVRVRVPIERLLKLAR